MHLRSIEKLMIFVLARLNKRFSQHQLLNHSKIINCDPWSWIAPLCCCSPLLVSKSKRRSSKRACGLRILPPTLINYFSLKLMRGILVGLSDLKWKVVLQLPFSMYMGFFPQCKFKEVAVLCHNSATKSLLCMCCCFLKMLEMLSGHLAFRVYWCQITFYFKLMQTLVSLHLSP